LFSLVKINFLGKNVYFVFYSLIEIQYLITGRMGESRKILTIIKGMEKYL